MELTGLIPKVALVPFLTLPSLVESSCTITNIRAAWSLGCLQESTCNWYQEEDNHILPSATYAATQSQAMPSIRESKHENEWCQAEAILGHLFRTTLQATHPARAGVSTWPWGSTNAVNKNLWFKRTVLAVCWFAKETVMDMREYYFVLQRKLAEAKYTEMDIKHLTLMETKSSLSAFLKA